MNKIINNIRWKLIGVMGRIILWIWTKTNRMTVVGEKALLKLRTEKKPVVLLVWHGRIFIVPFFFRKRNIMPLVSPSGDGEIAARIMDGWGYRILRGSSSHSIVKEWKEMVKELNRGGEVIIVPDGPKGPDRKMKLGGLKLAQKTGAYLVPFTFSTNKKKILKSWDSFLMFYPFRKVVAMYGEPISIDAGLRDEKLENERQKVEDILIELDHKADKFFD
jgi:lysophospholipid acyltransferase (LPLAT)-like uncharacterized protein